MNIINKNVGLLSNFEVYQLLKDIREGKNGYSKPDRSPCRNQSKEQLCLLMKDLEKFNLTKAERLQLVNFLPSTPVEIQLMIEESEERLSEQDIETLLHVISKYDK